MNSGRNGQSSLIVLFNVNMKEISDRKLEPERVWTSTVHHRKNALVLQANRGKVQKSSMIMEFNKNILYSKFRTFKDLVIPTLVLEIGHTAFVLMDKLAVAIIDANEALTARVQKLKIFPIHFE